MRKFILSVSFLSVLCLSFGSAFNPQTRLIWNRTDSAPKGLYWLSDDPFTLGRWVVVSSQSADAGWAQAHGYVGHNWPLLKQIAGVSGDEICRYATRILINGILVGEAHLSAGSGEKLPVWEGCVVLSQDQVFLMNAHPDSLDGRYFGITDRSDLAGVAHLIFAWR